MKDIGDPISVYRPNNSDGNPGQRLFELLHIFGRFRRKFQAFFVLWMDESYAGGMQGGAVDPPEPSDHHWSEFLV